MTTHVDGLSVAMDLHELDDGRDQRRTREQRQAERRCSRVEEFRIGRSSSRIDGCSAAAPQRR